MKSPPNSTFSTAKALVENTVNKVLKNRVECPHVLLSPVVRLEDRDKRLWRFVIASGDGSGFFAIMIGCDTRELAEECRMLALAKFLGHMPIVLHDTDDELHMARLCETIWPCEKTRKIRAGIETERLKTGAA
jgi:hypothetical protein